MFRACLVSAINRHPARDTMRTPSPDTPLATPSRTGPGWRVAMLVLVSAATTALLLLDDRLQQAVSANNRAVLQPGWVAGLMTIVMCLWLGGSRWVANAVIGAFAGMQLFQLCHIAAIGRALTPLDVAMIPHELSDIAQAVRAGAGAHWPTLFAGGVPYALAFAMFNLGLPRLRLPRLRWALLIVALVFATQFYNASRYTMKRFMPRPERSSLHNSLLAFSYCAANLVGKSVRRNALSYRAYTVVARDDPDAARERPRDVWLVIFDSTRTDHWGLAGYARATTPTMSRWVAQGQARWHRGLAGAVSTRASLGLLFNGVHEPGNIAQLRSHQANLLRLAKRAGYRTYWLSTQHGDLLDEIDAPSIDVIRTRGSDEARIAAVGDDAVLDMLDAVDPNAPRLVVMMLRTAHIPYDDAYRRHGGRYRRWPDGEGLTEGARLLNAYDNAIVYQDALVEKLYRRFERGRGDGLFVVTSDHGQMLGEDGVWGHNVLTQQIAQVPMLVRTRGAAQMPLAGNGDWLSHHDLARALAWRMGFSIHNPNARAGVDYLQGSDLFGDNLFREMRIVDGHLQLGELSGLGHSHEGHAHGAGDRESE